jgi:U3 small nucleolar RNA-associated protein 18
LPPTPSKLFFVDDGPAKKSAIEHDIDVGSPEDQSDPPTSEDEGQSEGDSSSSIPDEPHDEAKTLNTTPPPSAPHPRPPKSRKAPAWADPDDASLEVSLASSARLRKLRDAPDEDAVDGREYERRLRRQFVKMNPTPEWATAARRKKRRRAESEGGADADADADTDADVSTLDLDALVTSSGGILDRKRRARLNRACSPSSDCATPTRLRRRRVR